MKNFNKLMNYSKTSTTLMIAFVVLVSVFMFLIYRKRMREGALLRSRLSKQGRPPPSYHHPPPFSDGQMSFKTRVNQFQPPHPPPIMITRRTGGSPSVPAPSGMSDPGKRPLPLNWSSAGKQGMGFYRQNPYPSNYFGYYY